MSPPFFSTWHIDDDDDDDDAHCVAIGKKEEKKTKEGSCTYYYLLVRSNETMRQWIVSRMLGSFFLFFSFRGVTRLQYHCLLRCRFQSLHFLEQCEVLQ